MAWVHCNSNDALMFVTHFEDAMDDHTQTKLWEDVDCRFALYMGEENKLTVRFQSHRCTSSLQ